MRLSKNTWSDDDIMKLNIYLQGFKGNNQDWTKKIYNTKKNCLAVPIPKLRQISKEILNGNYLQLLEVYFRNIEKSNNLINDLNIDLNIIIGSLICCIEDVNLINKYLLMYGKISDSWVETDIIKLKINNKNKGKCFEIAKK